MNTRAPVYTGIPDYPVYAVELNEIFSSSVQSKRGQVGCYRLLNAFIGCSKHSSSPTNAHIFRALQFGELIGSNTDRANSVAFRQVSERRESLVKAWIRGSVADVAELHDSCAVLLQNTEPNKPRAARNAIKENPELTVIKLRTEIARLVEADSQAEANQLFAFRESIELRRKADRWRDCCVVLFVLTAAVICIFGYYAIHHP